MGHEFGPLPTVGRTLCYYDAELGRGLLPADLQDSGGLNFFQRRHLLKRRQQWLDERGAVLAVGGGADYSWFQMYEPYQTSDAVAVTAATETALTQDFYLALPPNSFSLVGKLVWFRAMGKASSVITTPGTYTFRLRWTTPSTTPGIGGTQLLVSGAITPNPVAVTDNLWYCDCWLQCIASGPLATSLTLLPYGQVSYANNVAPTTTALAYAGYMPPPGTSLANVASLDQTISKALTLTVTPTVTTGSVTVRNAFIVAMN